MNFSGITQNPKQVFSYNGKDVNMSCACGPLSLTSIIESKGKSNKLYEYLSNSGYTLNKLSGSGSQSQKMAALTFSKMSNSGLNGPTMVMLKEVVHGVVLMEIIQLVQNLVLL